MGGGGRSPRGGGADALLRKGGIHERGGRFEPEHDAFLICPTYAHQKPEALKPDWQGRCVDDRINADEITIRHLARVTEVLEAPPSAGSAPAWDAVHVYAQSLIEQRYAYKPERPLYVLLVRVYRLAAPLIVRETPAYAGCRSWVPLDEEASIDGAVPVLDDASFEQRATEIRAALPA